MSKSKWRIDADGRECSKCGEYKDWNAFNKNNKSSNGYDSSCRLCKSKRRKELYVPTTPKYLINKGGRECASCKQFKSWDSFSASNTAKNKHQSMCKSCFKARHTPKPNLLITEEGRECSKCGEFKLWEDFSLFKKGTHGHESRCKNCKNSLSDEQRRRKKKREHERYYSDLEKSRARARRNSKKARSTEEGRQRIHNWVIRYRKDPHNLLAIRLRGRVREALKYNKAKKNHRTLTLTGCTINFLHDHLNTNNRGLVFGDNDVHIDHIIPVDYFDLSIEVEKFICFNWRNLQLLPAHENLVKSNSTPDNVEELYTTLKTKVVEDIEKGIIYE